MLNIIFFLLFSFFLLLFVSLAIIIFLTAKFESPDTSYIHTITNHPVHIKDSPSAFIPFCEFSGDMLVMGEKIKDFDYPVCNKFKPKVLNGQLCYQVDVNEFKDKIVDKMITEPELIFLLDYNEEKMLTTNSDPKNDVRKNMFEMQDIDIEKIEAMIYIETIGRCITS